MTLIALALTACESGTYRAADIVIPDAVASGFDADSPGVLVTDLTGTVEPILALCGQSEPDPIEYYRDGGFGCLGDLKGTDVRVRAWVQPHPQAWTAAAICTAPRGDRGTLGLPGLEPAEASTTAGSDTGWAGAPSNPTLTNAPEPVSGQLEAEPAGAWAQGFDDARWRRDGSPCGGRLRADIEL